MNEDGMEYEQALEDELVALKEKYNLTGFAFFAKDGTKGAAYIHMEGSSLIQAMEHTVDQIAAMRELAEKEHLDG